MPYGCFLVCFTWTIYSLFLTQSARQLGYFHEFIPEVFVVVSIAAMLTVCYVLIIILHLRKNDENTYNYVI